MTEFKLPKLDEALQRLDLLMAQAFGSDEPAMQDWVAVRFALQERTPPEAVRKLTEIVHVAVSRALDEADIRNEVLRGMCIEVALETLPQPQRERT